MLDDPIVPAELYTAAYIYITRACGRCFRFFLPGLFPPLPLFDRCTITTHPGYFDPCRLQREEGGRESNSTLPCFSNSRSFDRREIFLAKKNAARELFISFVA